DRITRALWGEVGGAGAGLKALDGPGTRRDVQTAWIDRLGSFVTGDVPGAPEDARALARLQLSRIDARAAKALAPGVVLGDDARAHLLESRARIKRLLDAGVEMSAGGGAPRAPGAFATH
ncbi:MAG TPA: hypothetical protein VMH61_04680, partial [Candidatus Acidoferrales bacterium]|nr:hypothetical protein [Candidatus Acidoferrales bacterium]